MPKMVRRQGGKECSRPGGFWAEFQRITGAVAPQGKQQGAEEGEACRETAAIMQRLGGDSGSKMASRLTVKRERGRGGRRKDQAPDGGRVGIF